MTGSGKVPEQVPNHGFREGSGAGSERQVPGRFRVSFSNDGFRLCYLWCVSLSQWEWT